MLILLPLVLVYLYALPALLETILLLLMSSDKKPPNMSLTHLTVSKVLPNEKLMTSHLTVLCLISTSLAPPCRVDLELLCGCNFFPNKGREFVVSAGASCAVFQENANAVDHNVLQNLCKVFLLKPPALTIYILKPFGNRLYLLLRQGRCHLHRVYYHSQNLYCLRWVKNWFFKFITNPRFRNR